MSERVARSFSRAFKLKVIERMAAGENVSALARELAVKRELLYRWREAFRGGGEVALRSHRGRPRRAEAVAMAAARCRASKANDLAAARRRIAELERKVGQQQLDMEFFRAALRHIEASHQASDAPGGMVSSLASKR
jgi:transposase-like protein